MPRVDFELDSLQSQNKEIIKEKVSNKEKPSIFDVIKKIYKFEDKIINNLLNNNEKIELENRIKSNMSEQASIHMILWMFFIPSALVLFTFLVLNNSAIIGTILSLILFLCSFIGTLMWKKWNKLEKETSELNKIIDSKFIRNVYNSNSNKKVKFLNNLMFMEDYKNNKKTFFDLKIEELENLFKLIINYDFKKTELNYDKKDFKLKEFKQFINDDDYNIFEKFSTFINKFFNEKIELSAEIEIQDLDLKYIRIHEWDFFNKLKENQKINKDKWLMDTKFHESLINWLKEEFTEYETGLILHNINFENFSLNIPNLINFKFDLILEKYKINNLNQLETKIKELNKDHLNGYDDYLNKFWEILTDQDKELLRNKLNKNNSKLKKDNSQSVYI